MKKLFILLLFIPFMSFAQYGGVDSSGQAMTIGAYASPGSWDDGFNVGAFGEYSFSNFYIKVEAFAAPGLQANNDLALDYYSLGAAFGVQFEFNLFNNFDGLRFSGGVREGFIYRETGGMHYVYLGVEGAIQYTFPNGLSFRVTGLTESATDSKLWSTNDNHNRKSVYAGIAYRFW